MIATRAIAAPAWDHVGIEFHDDNGRTVNAQLPPAKAAALAQEIAEVANGFRSNEVVTRWAIGPTTPVTSKPGTGYSEVQWGERNRNRLRVHPSRLRDLADLLHDLADKAEG